MVAEEQHLIDERSDLVVRRLDEAELQILWRELDAVEVPRDPSVRRQQRDRGRMGVLIDLRIVGVAETDRRRQRLDRRLASGQEVHVGRRLRMVVAAEKVLLSLGGHRRRLAGIEAHEDDVELLAGSERHAFERPDQPVQHLRAEHRALVIHEREQHRPLAEVLAERDLLARLVGERQVERDLLVQLLIDADVLEHRDLL